jgi:N6-L-threonylcarbamoyladenine synthase
MYILGIESSCDDTSVALLHSSEAGQFVISEKTASQIDVHKQYGGVVPEVAGRLHAEKITPLIEAVLAGHPTPDAIAVTSGPGLITGLLVGTTAAKTLSYTKNIPLIPTNHLLGHVHSVEISTEKGVPREKITFPALALVVSGGHTELVLMTSNNDCRILGATKDDAAGECFDKVAKLLQLPYPGGPQISKLALTGRTDAIAFPRPMLQDASYAFSFSGLKTSALYWLRDNTLSSEISINDFAASLEQAIVDVLVTKTIRAAREFSPKSIILAGGVSANKKLRSALEEAVKKHSSDTRFLMALPHYCMDNGAMIAAAGYYQAQKQHYTDWRAVTVDPNWKIDQKKY